MLADMFAIMHPSFFLKWWDSPVPTKGDSRGCSTWIARACLTYCFFLPFGLSKILMLILASEGFSGADGFWSVLKVLSGRRRIKGFSYWD